MAERVPKATKIRELRIKKGLSQQELAMRVLTTRQIVDQWEKGCVAPTLKNSARIAAVLGCTIDDLISWEDGKPSEAEQ